MVEEEDEEDDDDELDRMRMRDLLWEGRALDLDGVEQLEKSVLENPQDIDSRIKLLGNYFTRKNSSSLIAKSRVAHISWLVDNRPEHPVCASPYINLNINPENYYPQVKAIWLKKIEANPTSAVILSNACHFFSLHSFDSGNKNLTEYYLVKCTQLEPHNIFWSRQLAHHYDRNGPKDAHKSFTENARIVELTTDQEELYITLTDLPLRAWRACEYKQTLIAAERLLRMSEDLKDDWNYGNAIQCGHTALGLLALRDDDLLKAKSHLAQSVLDEPTTQTEIYGPNFQLAEALLTRGEKQAVLEYLNKCEPLCDFDNSKLLAMRAQINSIT